MIGGCEFKFFQPLPMLMIVKTIMSIWPEAAFEIPDTEEVIQNFDDLPMNLEELFVYKSHRHIENWHNRNGESNTMVYLIFEEDQAIVVVDDPQMEETAQILKAITSFQTSPAHESAADQHS